MVLMVLNINLFLIRINLTARLSYDQFPIGYPVYRIVVLSYPSHGTPDETPYV